MFWTAMFLALLIAFALSVMLAGVVRWRHPAASGFWPALLFAFLVLFLAAWAGGLWLKPVGPEVLGAPWVPYVVVGVIVALLLLALAAPSRASGGAARAVDDAEETAVVGAVFSIFFYALLLALVVAIVVHYVASPDLFPVLRGVE